MHSPYTQWGGISSEGAFLCRVLTSYLVIYFYLYYQSLKIEEIASEITEK